MEFEPDAVRQQGQHQQGRVGAELWCPPGEFGARLDEVKSENELLEKPCLTAV